MAIKLLMPKLGLNMVEGQLTEWLKKEGDQVKQGEAIYTVETDKVTSEVEAQQDGVLAKVLVNEGDTVPVRKVVGILAEEGEEVDLGALLIEEKETGSGGGTKPEKKEEAKPEARSSSHAGGEPVLASPLAKRLAAQNGIDLNEVRGSGPGGRINVEDVEQAIAGGKLEPEEGELTGRVVPMKGIRKVVSDRMSQAAKDMAMVTLHATLDVTSLVSFRNSEKEKGKRKEEIPGYNAILASLVAKALKEFPYLNARFTQEGIRLIDPVNIGVAVDTEDGLTVVVVPDTDKKKISDIQKDLTEMVERALAHKSKPEDLGNGTFTITNLGMYGVDGFTPIINPPQSGILGIGQFAKKRPEGGKENAFQAVFSLTFDHRVIDGAPAARFLQRLGEIIVNFSG